jgi:hypothetical protein
MKRILTLYATIFFMLFFSVPTYGDNSGAQTLRNLYHLDSDSGATPGFFARRVGTKCGQFQSTAPDEATGTTNSGTEVYIRHDSRIGMIALTVDGHPWTGFLDAAGHLVEVHAPDNAISRHTPASDADAQAEIKAHGAEFASLLANCGVKVSAPKCGLDGNTFSAPLKADCDPFSDSGYWGAYFEPEYDDALLQFEIQQITQAQCQAQKDACASACNDVATLGGIYCGALINPYYIMACEAGNLAAWGACRNHCSTIC